VNQAEDEFARAVGAISLGNVAQSALEVLDAMVEGGQVAQLASAVLSAEQLSCATKEDAVRQTMRKFESLAATSQPTACALMARLWPVASGLFMHDVCDAIDLWIASCASDTLSDQLKLMAQSESDPNNRRHYEEWIQNRNTRDTGRRG
jgi:hypothetical protein